jgi:hypothetical protein
MFFLTYTIKQHARETEENPCVFRHFRHEDGDSMFLRNVGIYLQVHAASQPRTITSSSSPP